MLLITIAGFAAVTWQWRQAEQARQEAQQNFEDAERHRQRREVNFDRALTAVDRMLTQVGEEDLAASAELAPVREAILKDALSMYQDLLTENPDNSSLRRETAYAHARLAAIRGILGQRQDAYKDWQSAIALLEELVEENHDDSGLCRNLARAYHSAANAASAGTDDKLRYYRQSFEIYEELQERDPGDTDIAVSVALACSHVAFSLCDVNRLDEAHAMTLRAIEMWRSIDVEDGGEHRRRLILATMHENLSHIAELRAEREEQVQALRDAVSIAESIVRELDSSDTVAWHGQSLPNPDQADEFQSYREVCARWCDELAILLTDPKDQDESNRLQERSRELRMEAIRFQEMRAERDLSNDLHRELLALRYRRHGDWLLTQEQSDEAEKYFRKSVEQYSGLASQSPRNTTYQRGLVAACVALAKRLEEREGGLTEAVATAEVAFDRTLSLVKSYPNDFESVRLQFTAGECYRSILKRQGKDEKAEKVFTKLTQLLETALQMELDEPSMLQLCRIGSGCQHDQGDFHLRGKRFAEAETAYRASLDLERRHNKAEPLHEAMRNRHYWTLHNLGRALLGQGRWDEAAASFLDAVGERLDAGRTLGMTGELLAHAESSLWEARKIVLEHDVAPKQAQRMHDVAIASLDCDAEWAECWRAVVVSWEAQRLLRTPEAAVETAESIVDRDEQRGRTHLATALIALANGQSRDVKEMEKSVRWRQCAAALLREQLATHPDDERAFVALCDDFDRRQREAKPTDAVAEVMGEEIQYWSKLASAHPQSPGLLIRALQQRDRLHFTLFRDADNRRQAITLLEEGVAQGEQRIDEHPDQVEVELKLLELKHRLVARLRRTGSKAAANQLIEATWKRLQQAASRTPDQQEAFELQQARFGKLMGDISAESNGDTAETEAYYRGAIETLEKLTSSSALGNQAAADLSFHWQRHGENLHDWQRYQDAIDSEVQSVQWRLRAMEGANVVAGHQRALTGHCKSLTRTLAVTDNISDELGGQFEGWAAAQPRPDLDVPEYWTAVGAGCLRAGKYDLARQALERARNLHKTPEPSTLFFLALAYAQMDQNDLALTSYRAALDCMVDGDPPEDELAPLRANTAKALRVEDSGS